MTDLQLTVLILAGKRDGALDPFAQAHGVSHKCLVPVAGRALIEHVLIAIAAAPEVDAVMISIDDPQAIMGLDSVRDMTARGMLKVIEAKRNLADSIMDAAGQARFPLLITTADNVLLTSGAIGQMAHEPVAMGADVAVAFARKDAVLAAHPDGQKRFYTFADDGYSNCNCYWIGDVSALHAANVFREGGQFAKHPMRIANAFGILNLIRFKLGIGTLADLFERFSSRLALEVRPVIFADGSLAIDVDNTRTHGIAEAILLARGA